MRFTGYSRESGLTQSTVYTIVQDRKGFMWFGTQEGLSRFDGYTMKAFKHIPESKNSLGGRSVFASLCDSRGNLWFGSEKGNLSKYIPEKDQFMIFRLRDDADSAREIYISSICQDHSGNIIVGSYGGGLHLLENGTTACYEEECKLVQISTEAKYISCLCLNNSGDLVVGTQEDGLYMASSEQLTANHSLIHSNKAQNLTGDFIRSVFVDSRSRIIAGTKYGLNIIADGVVTKFTADERNGSLPNNVVTSISEDRNGRLWIATRNGGLNLYDEEHSRFVTYQHDQNNPHTLPENSLLSVYIDRTNVIWSGTVSSGVCKADLDSKNFYNPEVFNKQFKQVKNVNCIYRHNDSGFYLGTNNRGFFAFDADFKNIKHYSNKSTDPENYFPGGSIYSICITEDSGIWIGASGSGLIRYDPETGKFQIFQREDDQRTKNVFSVCADKKNKGLLFIGTQSGGFFVFDTILGRYKDSELTILAAKEVSNSVIRTVFSGASGEVWFSASNEGLMMISAERDKVVKMSFADERFSDDIRHISEDSLGNLLICTAGNGLLRYNPSRGVMCSYTENEGLASNSAVAAMADNNGNIWVCTVNGLSKIDELTGKIYNFYESDNLLSREFNEGAIHKDSSGTIYLGNPSGMNYFKPQEIVNNPHKPVVALIDFRIFNKSYEHFTGSNIIDAPVPYADMIHLTYKERVFSFGFSSLIYNDSTKNQFAYMLEGFDKNWIYSGNRRNATYTNIGAGEYIFKVKATNNDGIWCDEPAKMMIQISPPFWETWWFKSAGVLASFLIARGIYRNKLKMIEKEKIIQDEFSRKLLESQESERRRIASELHDTIAHDILVLKNKAYLGFSKEEQPENLKNVLKEISDLSADALGDVRSISYNLHPYKIERLGLTKAVVSMLNLAEESSGISINSKIDNINNLMEKELELYVYRIIQELMNNIIKHSGATKAVFAVTASDSKVCINVIDNGKGIRNLRVIEAGNTGLGLMGIKTRLRLYDGFMEIKVPQNGGTSITISIPNKYRAK